MVQNYLATSPTVNMTMAWIGYQSEPQPVNPNQPLGRFVGERRRSWRAVQGAMGAPAQVHYGCRRLALGTWRMSTHSMHIAS